MKKLKKLYEMVGIKGIPQVIPSSGEIIGYDSPEFTELKAYKLLKVLTKAYSAEIDNFEERGYNLTFKSRSSNTTRNVTYTSVTRPTIEECMVRVCMDLWDSIAKPEQDEIRKILDRK